MALARLRIENGRSTCLKPCLKPCPDACPDAGPEDDPDASHHASGVPTTSSTNVVTLASLSVNSSACRSGFRTYSS